MKNLLLPDNKDALLSYNVLFLIPILESWVNLHQCYSTTTWAAYTTTWPNLISLRSICRRLFKKMRLRS